MSIEETVAQLLEANIKGEKLYHFVQEASFSDKFYITSTNRQHTGIRNSIFAHLGGRECLAISVGISLSEAIEIVKKYWDRRI